MSYNHKKERKSSQPFFKNKKNKSQRPIAIFLINKFRLKQNKNVKQQINHLKNKWKEGVKYWLPVFFHQVSLHNIVTKKIFKILFWNFLGITVSLFWLTNKKFSFYDLLSYNSKFRWHHAINTSRKCQTIQTVFHL